MIYANLKTYFRSLLPVLVGFLSVIGALLVVFGGRLAELEIPIHYGVESSLTPNQELLWRPVGSDASFGFDQVDLPLSLTASRMMSEGSLGESSRLNHPFGYDGAAFPVIAEWGNTILFRAILLVADDPAKSVNYFYLASFLVCYFLTYTLLNTALKSKWYRASAAVIFTLLPAHFGKEPFFFSNYWVSVLAVLLIIEIFDQPSILKRKKIVIYSLILSGFGFYWCIFSLCFVALALVFSLIQHDRKRSGPLLEVFIAFLLSTSLTFAWSLKQSFSFVAEHGQVDRLRRLPSVVDSWPLRVLDGLVAPPYFQWFPQLSRDYFVRGSERVGEGLFTYGPYGFVALTLALGVVMRRNWPRANQSIYFVALALLFSPLLMGVGGIAHLPGVFGLTTIKSWERAQVVLAFFSLVFLFMFLERIARKKLTKALIGSSLAVGLIVALPFGHFSKLSEARSRWESQSEFFGDLEESFPSSNAYWFPPEVYPEGPATLYAPPYSSLYGYIGTRSIRWTAGAITGLTGRWQTEKVGVDPLVFTNYLADQKIDLLVIDRFAWDFSNITEFLTWLDECAGTIVSTSSSDGRYTAVPLRVVFSTSSNCLRTPGPYMIGRD